MTVVLVTGATGFLGRALIKELRSPDVELRACARSLMNDLGVPCILINDIGPDTDWHEALQGVDVVYHLAGLSEGADSSITDEDFDRVNAKGTLRLMQEAAQANVKRVIMTSTIKVLGELSGAKPFDQHAQPNPQTAYARSKLYAEQSAIKIADEFKFDLTIVRFPLAFGVGVAGNFARLASLVQKGIPLPFKAANNKRSLVGLVNAVDLLCCLKHHDKAAGQTFLIADQPSVSTEELLGKIAQAMGVRLTLFPLQKLV
jgi:UDP-N-acetyl-alpha-D-quinovosamine dehydrogenase